VEEIGNFPFFLPDYFGGKLAVPEGTVIPPHFNNGFTCPDYEIKQVGSASDFSILSYF
jgi:hypothetical protein